MAENPQQPFRVSDNMKRILGEYGGIRQALASGKLSVDEEIKIREEAANSLVQRADQTGQQSLIADAIQHVDTILRRLPRDSLDRAKYFSKLSYIKMSEYTATNSRRALNDAVLNGRQAKDAAVASNLLNRDPWVYFEMLMNYGYALSQRYALLQEPQDLEDAIACSRETHEKAEKDSRAYIMNLNNYASRLRLRYNKDHNNADINKAMSLINELQSKTNPGSTERAMAVAQLGVMGVDKFERTHELQDLDDALKYSLIGLDTLENRPYELIIPGLRVVSYLYRKRYEKTSELSDLRNASKYSCMLFHVVPRNHTSRGTFLVDSARDMYKVAEKAHNSDQTKIAIRAIKLALNEMPKRYPEKRHCQGILADLFLDAYSATCKLQDLLLFVEAVDTITSDYNNEVDHGDLMKGTADTIWLWNLRKFLRVIVNAQSRNSMRVLAEEEMPPLLRNARQSQSSPVTGLLEFHRMYGRRLQIISDAIERNVALSNNEIASEAAKLEEQKSKELEEQKNRRPFKTDDYNTEFGVRKLAMGDNGNLIMDLSGMMSSILGYDVTKKYTAEEMATLSAREEQKSLKEARLKGRHPNTSLCRMCRDYAKLLKPSPSGFELTAEHAWVPFGNYFQLRLRKTCSICSLIFSLITTKTGALHPKLSSIDPEVQGTRLTSGRLSTGERILRVDYGLKHVGEIRVVTAENRSQVLRQATDADKQFKQPVNLDKHHEQQRLDPNLINSWLNDCDNNHGSVCNHPRAEKRTANSMSMNFIDVQDGRLLAATSDEKYFALSYTWGRVEMYKTLKANYDERKRPGSLFKIPFPKTIRDAAQFVRSLGERYLWVDALCLVQDDTEQMARDVPNMDIVYGQAFATIVALDGNDANAGLAGVRGETRAPQPITTLTISDKSPHLDDDPDSKDREVVRLVATPRPLYLALELTQWNTRGWIVQEHLLSKRCIYFAPDAVYFECGQETRSEGGVNEKYVGHFLGKGDGTDNIDANTIEPTNYENPLFGLDTVYDLPQYKRLTKTFHAYTKLVATYSQRNLSFKSDILNAFAGMFAVLEEHFQSTTLNGLPAAVFSHALLWTPVARLSRRGAELPTAIQGPSNPDPKFPSWSWVGWDGPVEYRILSEAKGGILLPIPQVKVYETVDGPISDAMPAAKEASISPTPAPAIGSGGSELTEHNEDNQTPKKQVLAKMVPDNVRGSTWIISGPPPAVPERNDPYIAAKLLRFTARVVPVPAFQISHTKEYLSHTSQVHMRSSQAVRRIFDRNGKHCGLWWEQAGYGYVGLGISPDAEDKIDMLEISRYGDVQRRRDGPSLVNGPISLFDDEVFPAVGPGSALVNILVVDFDMGLPDGIGERCTVAVMHAAAWEAEKPKEKEIRMV